MSPVADSATSAATSEASTHTQPCGTATASLAAYALRNPAHGGVEG